MTKKEIEGFQKKLAKRIEILIKERDELREMESEISGLADDVDEAIESLCDAQHSLDDAADSLSKNF